MKEYEVSTGRRRIHICFIKLTKEEKTQPETQVYRQIIQQEDADSSMRKRSDFY